MSIPTGRAAPLVILHLSDVHARQGQPLDDLAARIVGRVKRAVTMPDVVVACGDFADKGRHHARGFLFVRRVAAGLGLAPAAIICCPGNHDIQAAAPERLGDYHRGAAELLSDAERAAPARAVIYPRDSADFLILNSAYELDPAIASVDLAAAERALAEASQRPVRVAVVHHHCIPVTRGDSPIANAYPLLRLLEVAGFDVLLHGHRHFASSITIGRKLKVIGVGSVNTRAAEPAASQFNLVSVGKWITRYRYVVDARRPTGVGDWHEESEAW